jgi:uncharacterized membrane protein YphA (DoxX/SURF4 family)
MKMIALYGLQTLVGLAALAAGCAKLADMDLMAEPFAMIGLGRNVLIMVGTVEIIAGLCLLYPRPGVAGAVLLVAVMACTMGATIGTAINQSGDSQRFAKSQTSHTNAGRRDGAVSKAGIVAKSRNWDI